jgi:hypothetical protein
LGLSARACTLPSSEERRGKRERETGVRGDNEEKKKRRRKEEARERR